MGQRLVAGIDSSTQACKVMVRDADSGELVRSGVVRHPSGTEIDPEIWWVALGKASELAGGLDDVSALAVAGQQHGMVALDSDGAVVRPALLWNDIRSAPQAESLIDDLGRGSRQAGQEAWAEATGSVPVASLTVTKLRWLLENEPENAARVAGVALPHDYLSWRLTGSNDLADLFTDRSEASGTGYFSGHKGEYRPDLLELAFGRRGRDLVLPTVLDPHDVGGQADIVGSGILIGPGCGDNAGAALGLGLQPGELAMSIGTSGVVSLVSNAPTFDSSGLVTGFADATGQYLPLACTLNGSRVLDAMAHALRVDHAGLSALALSAPQGAEGLVLVPYLEGERTPNVPEATGALHGIRLDNMTPANLARAAVEGMLCGVAAGVAALRALDVPVNRISLIGGGAQSEAVRRIAPSVLGMPVSVPEVGEYVADGAARQAAWVLAGGEEPPSWIPRLTNEYDGAYAPFILERYAEVNHLTASRSTLSMSQ